MGPVGVVMAFAEVRGRGVEAVGLAQRAARVSGPPGGARPAVRTLYFGGGARKETKQVSFSFRTFRRIDKLQTKPSIFASWR